MNSIYGWGSVKLGSAPGRTLWDFFQTNLFQMMNLNRVQVMKLPMLKAKIRGKGKPLGLQLTDMAVTSHCQCHGPGPGPGARAAVTHRHCHRLGLRVAGRRLATVALSHGLTVTPPARALPVADWWQSRRRIPSRPAAPAVW